MSDELAYFQGSFDAVNLAARMEGLTKRYGAGLLITGDTTRNLQRPDEFPIGTVDRVLVKGKHDPVEIVELFAADSPEDRDAKLASLERLEAAMQCCTAGAFADALAGFEGMLAINPGDGAARLPSRRCRGFLQRPPAEWRGVVAMEK